MSRGQVLFFVLGSFILGWTLGNEQGENRIKTEVAPLMMDALKALELCERALPEGDGGNHTPAPVVPHKGPQAFEL